MIGLESAMIALCFVIVAMYGNMVALSGFSVVLCSARVAI